MVTRKEAGMGMGKNKAAGCQPIWTVAEKRGDSERKWDLMEKKLVANDLLSQHYRVLGRRTIARATPLTSFLCARKSALFEIRLHLALGT